MVTLLTKEHKFSSTETRSTNYAHAVAMSEKGGFYSAQVVNEFGIILLEVKSG